MIYELSIINTELFYYMDGLFLKKRCTNEYSTLISARPQYPIDPAE